MPSSVLRLMLIVLLVARLLVGDLANAMSDDGSAHLDHTPAAQTSSDGSCADHTPQPDGDEHDENCCKSACSCPCLHLSALTPPTLVAQALLSDVHLQMPVVGVPARLIGRLLRPPA